MLSKVDANMLYETLLSTRRIFHISTDSSVSESEIFKDIFFSSYGTGILIKLNDLFFLITARHVLDKYMVDNPVNSSPFRVQVDAQKGFDNTNDFLYPNRIWDIGKIIESSELYEYEDVVLVELFPAMPNQVVKKFIDINNSHVLKVKDFKENSFVAESGYSMESNPYSYEHDDLNIPFDESKFTCSTQIKRDFIYGFLYKENDYFYMKKKFCQLADTNGMSGGLLATIENGIPNLVGMHLRSCKQSDRINFLPFEKVISAIHSYTEAPCYIIDYMHYARFKDKSNLKPIWEFMDEDLLSKLGTEDEVSEQLMQELFNFFVKNQKFLEVHSVEKAMITEFVEAIKNMQNE